MGQRGPGPNESSLKLVNIPVMHRLVKVSFFHSGNFVSFSSSLFSFRPPAPTHI